MSIEPLMTRTNACFFEKGRRRREVCRVVSLTLPLVQGGKDSSGSIADSCSFPSGCQQKTWSYVLQRLDDTFEFQRFLQVHVLNWVVAHRAHESDCSLGNAANCLAVKMELAVDVESDGF